MALKTCSECKGKMSDQAVMCPHCGFGQAQALEGLLRKATTTGNHTAPVPVSGAKTFGEEKRRHRRIDHRTMVTVNGNMAILFNVSRSGLKLAAPFTPVSRDVNITLDNGEQLFELNGVVRWVSSRLSFSNLVDFGVEITDPPPEYYEFIDKLQAMQ
jgi:hypothetical protein